MIDLFGIARSTRAMEALAIAVSISITARGFIGGLLGRVAGQREHLFHVLHVGGADFSEVRRIDDVVIAVGQGECRPDQISAICCDESFSSWTDTEFEETVGRAAIFKLS